jgi:hypothetical protein
VLSATSIIPLCRTSWRTSRLSAASTACLLRITIIIIVVIVICDVIRFRKHGQSMRTRIRRGVLLARAVIHAAAATVHARIAEFAVLTFDLMSD